RLLACLQLDGTRRTCRRLPRPSRAGEARPCRPIRLHARLRRLRRRRRRLIPQISKEERMRLRTRVVTVAALVAGSLGTATPTLAADSVPAARLAPYADAAGYTHWVGQFEAGSDL